jgi:hypothetical protein
MEFDYLSKYCKFKKSIAVLKRQSEIEAKASKEVFGALEKSKRQELAVLEHYIDSLEAQLKACDQEVHTMKHYKVRVNCIFDIAHVYHCWPYVVAYLLLVCFQI